MSRVVASVLVGAAALAVAHAEVYMKEKFTSDTLDGWEQSFWKGETCSDDWQTSGRKSCMGKWEVTSGSWAVDADEQKGLRTTENMAFHAISKKFDKPFSNRNKDLVVQFSVKHETYSYGHCAGGYLKLLPKAGDPKEFGGDTKYNIMFGPDLCSYDVSKIHLIFNKGSDNLQKKDEIKLDYDEKNEFTHLYTLHLKPDNSAEVFFDQKSKWAGKLEDGWDLPGKEIRDPEDPLKVPDPEAEKPEDWNEEDDGEFEAPLIDNPSPKMIPNPEYGGDVYAYDFAAIGFELWTVNNGTIFDNILVTDDIDYAKSFGASTWGKIKDGEKGAKEAWEKKKEEKKDEEKKDEL